MSKCVCAVPVCMRVCVWTASLRSCVCAPGFCCCTCAKQSQLLQAAWRIKSCVCVCVCVYDPSKILIDPGQTLREVDKGRALEREGCGAERAG